MVNLHIYDRYKIAVLNKTKWDMLKLFDLSWFYYQEILYSKNSTGQIDFTESTEIIKWINKKITRRQFSIKNHQIHTFEKTGMCGYTEKKKGREQKLPSKWSKYDKKKS